MSWKVLGGGRHSSDFSPIHQQGVTLAGYTILPRHSISFCKMEMIPWVPSHFGASFNSEASSGRGCSCLVAKWYQTLCDPMDGSTGSSVLTVSRSLPILKLVSGQGGGVGDTQNRLGVMPQASALGGPDAMWESPRVHLTMLRGILVFLKETFSFCVSWSLNT